VAIIDTIQRNYIGATWVKGDIRYRVVKCLHDEGSILVARVSDDYRYTMPPSTVYREIKASEKSLRREIREAAIRSGVG